MKYLLIATLVLLVGCNHKAPLIKRDQLMLQVPEELLVPPTPLKPL